MGDECVLILILGTSPPGKGRVDNDGGEESEIRDSGRDRIDI